MTQKNKVSNFPSPRDYSLNSICGNTMTSTTNRFNKRNKSVFTANQFGSIISDNQKTFDKQRYSTTLKINKNKFAQKKLEKKEQFL